MIHSNPTKAYSDNKPATALLSTVCHANTVYLTSTCQHYSGEWPHTLYCTEDTSKYHEFIDVPSHQRTSLKCGQNYLVQMLSLVGRGDYYYF